MSRPKIEINDNDIAHAEMILFGKGGAFDDDRNERKAFIKNLETIDLQAVPGSGKTTVLLAKLLILERHLPFEEGSGILVISHTNAAVNEIKKRIGQYCPKLFAYPNFVGTIQTFADIFLAIPHYTQKYGKRPWRIDDESYNENIYIPAKAYAWLDNHPYQKGDVLYESRLNENDELVIANYRFPLKDRNSDTYISLLEMKQALREKGILCYDDAYVLALKAIKLNPILQRLLQQRFRYAFVDEMQDMDYHQYNLLEQIFNDVNSSSIYQRIGDKNQAIFSGDIKLDDIWISRATVLPITGSRRLSSMIAKIVEPFGMPREPIVGRNAQEDALPPHVIVFDDNSISNVLPKFCELVRKYIDGGKIPENYEYPIKAIAWRKGEDGKFGLKNYWPDFETNAFKSKTDYPNFKSYLLFAKKEGSQKDGIESIYKSILNAFLKVLRLEQVKNPESKTGYFSIGSLQKHLKDEHTGFYEDFRLLLFHWCRDIYSEKINHAFSDIKNIIPQFVNCFGRNLEKSFEFVNDESSLTISEPSDKSSDAKPKNNIYRCQKTDIAVEIGTVHSVKGQTHTATLYLESYYYKDGNGENAKSYESQRLKEQFAGQTIADKVSDRTKQSARMVYVGFSRPTHLLCFAVHKDRFDPKAFSGNGWLILKV
ncbi:MAG: UvrD-helicase domain-containing protein [Sedimentisphaerales bacterium]